MSGSRAQGLEAAKTIKSKYGEDYYVKLGAMGGKAQVPKGFARMDKEKRSAAGRKGGHLSSRLGIPNGSRNA